MDSVVPNLFGGAFGGRRVLVTGHTGFKGAWLCEWLLQLGAEVSGIGLPPDTEPSLFHQLRLEDRVQGVFADIRNGDGVRRLIAETRPDFLFHLAAQPLVRKSYREPVLTWQTNVLGTIHVLEALRAAEAPCNAVFVTTDKCYENQEWHYGYRETDPLGGFDPYSSSKAAAEIAIGAWRRSYFGSRGIRFASARAGNVIGGGDWAEDRIVPDCVRSWLDGRTVKVRNPRATRPWQHVLEPIAGYLALAAALARAEGSHSILESPFNFGPDREGNRTVRELVETALRYVPGEWHDASDPSAPHEANLLHLSTDKSEAVLGWQPVWGFEEAVRATFKWYFDVGRKPDPETPRRRLLDQIASYTASAANHGLPWAKSSESTPSPPRVQSA
ncbi:MAG: CDP-glucose 4,6-dehydratase [Verrucomicrobiales bacterium]|nr:CDP-glucose 4,6-dehydratase [Verrucomicrobiales bacterium]